MFCVLESFFQTTFVASRRQLQWLTIHNTMEMFILILDIFFKNFGWSSNACKNCSFRRLQKLKGFGGWKGFVPSYIKLPSPAISNFRSWSPAISNFRSWKLYRMKIRMIASIQHTFSCFYSNNDRCILWLSVRGPKHSTIPKEIPQFLIGLWTCPMTPTRNHCLYFTASIFICHHTWLLHSSFWAGSVCFQKSCWFFNFVLYHCRC